MRILSITLLTLMLWSCQQQKDTLKVSIESMEEQVKEDPIMDSGLAKTLTDSYLEYAEKHKEDTISPYYLSRAADILKEMKGGALKSINTYNKIINEYPQHKLVPRSVFMVGYVFDEKLKDKKRAAKSYTYFLTKYPNHPLADDAENLLKMTQDQRSEEEIIEGWLEKSKNDTNPKSQQ